MMEEKGLPKRKTMRAKYYDYSSTGAYFLTICAKEKKHILSCIVGTGVPTVLNPENWEANELYN